MKLNNPKALKNRLKCHIRLYTNEILKVEIL